MPNGGQLEVNPELTLRERKRRRTRAAVIEAGRRLFEERGYDQTTVADIAAAAEIGTRTFFAYFPSKEQLLFPESDARVQAALSAIASRTTAQTPVQVLLRALEDTFADRDELIGELAQLRLRLIRDVPAVQARALRLQAQAQHQIAAALCAAYPNLIRWQSRHSSARSSVRHRAPYKCSHPRPIGPNDCVERSRVRLGRAKD